MKYYRTEGNYCLACGRLFIGTQQGYIYDFYCLRPCLPVIDDCFVLTSGI
jgi:hypothetical protein